MTGPYSLLVTSGFERIARRLSKRDSEFAAARNRVRRILERDPSNHTQRHNLRKLKDVSHGSGQYRLRVGQFRFRYDIYPREKEVVLTFCGRRGKDTYKVK